MNSELDASTRQLLERAKAGQMRAPKGMKLRVKSVVLADAAAARRTQRPDAAQWLAKPWVSGVLIALAGALAVVSMSVKPNATRVTPATVQTAPPPAAEVQAQPTREILPTAEPTAPALSQPSAARPQARAVEPDEPKTRSKHGSGTDLRAEMLWLARVEAELRDGAAQAALRELRTGRARFAHGQLQAEREGLELIAQCKLGRDRALSEALSRYIERTPKGVLVERVKRACSPAESR
jgi:hypothetical protein